MFKKTQSRTSTTQRTAYNSTTNTTDNRVAADAGAIVTRSGDVTVTDGGAITMAGEVAEQAIDAGEMFAQMSRDITRDSFELATSSMGSTIKTLEAVIDSERDDAAQLSEQLVNMIPWVVAGVVAWSIFK